MKSHRDKGENKKVQQYVKNQAYIKLLAIMLSVIVGMFFGQTKALAEGFPFEVQTIIPENQVDKDKTYFDLKLDKGEKQTVEVLIRNLSDEDITVEMAFNRLTTNSNGVMEYKKVDGKPDKSAEVDIEKIVKLSDEEINIKANSDVRAKLTIKAPKKDFPGILAGGLTFRLKSKDDDDKKVKETTEKNMEVKNQYGYDIALVLHGNVPVGELPTELVLSTVGISNTNGRNLIFANLQNPQPKNLKNMTIDMKLIDSETQEIVFENKKSDLEAAPNSNFDYSIPLSGAIIEAGDYTLKLGIEVAAKKIELEKEFKINAVEASKIEEEMNPTVKKNYFFWYLLMVLLLITGVVIFLLLKYPKYQKKLRRLIYKNDIKKKKDKKRKS